MKRYAKDEKTGHQMNTSAREVKNQKREEAQVRAEARAKRSPVEQLSILATRPGKSEKENARLAQELIDLGTKIAEAKKAEKEKKKAKKNGLPKKKHKHTAKEAKRLKQRKKKEEEKA